MNKSVGSVLEFQRNEPQNQQKIVTPMNNKAAATSKMMELLEQLHERFAISSTTLFCPVLRGRH